MSNNNKPRFSLPGMSSGSAPPAPLAPPPAPPAPPAALGDISANVAALIAKFPLPWCVGPDGYLWVAADVEKVTDRDELNKLGVTPDGWRATGNVARLVLEHKLSDDMAAVVLYAVNKLGKA